MSNFHCLPLEIIIISIHSEKFLISICFCHNILTAVPSGMVIIFQFLGTILVTSHLFSNDSFFQSDKQLLNYISKYKICNYF